MKEEGYGTGSIVLAFLAGGVVGAGVALLLAPQSGSETREKIKDMADDVKQKAKGYAKQTADKVTEVVHEGKDVYEKNKSYIKSAIDAGKEAYEKEKEKLSKQAA